jgi:hypothetical protein
MWFQNRRQIAAYLGLAPTSYESGEFSDRTNAFAGDRYPAAARSPSISGRRTSADDRRQMPPFVLPCITARTPPSRNEKLPIESYIVNEQ